MVLEMGLSIVSVLPTADSGGHESSSEERQEYRCWTSAMYCCETIVSLSTSNQTPLTETVILPCRAQDLPLLVWLCYCVASVNPK